MADATFLITHPQELIKRASRMAEDVTGKVADDTRSRTPVDTGRLARGWRVVQGEGTQWLLVNDVPYARFIEYGTRYVRAVAMLGQAAAQARSRYE